MTDSANNQPREADSSPSHPGCTVEGAPEWILVRAMDHLAEGVLVTDPRQTDNPIVYCNRAFMEMTGYSRDEVIGRNCRFLQGDPDTADESSWLARREIRLAIQEERSCRVVVRNFRRNGEMFLNDVTIAPVRDPAGDVSAFVGIQRDITDLIESVDRNRELCLELQHASRGATMVEITAALVHEISQPLTAISGFVHACREGLKNGASFEELDGLLSNVQQQYRWICDIVSQTRHFMSRSNGVQEDCDINDIVDRAVHLMGGYLRDSHVDVQLAQVCTGATVHADPLAIQQVVVNLLMNAIDAIDAMQPEDDSRRTIQISSVVDGDVIQVTVQDSGPGTDAETASRIFDSFFTTKPRGLGMGLAIARRIVESHGGQINASADSEPGLTIAFTLPTAAAKL